MNIFVLAQTTTALTQMPTSVAGAVVVIGICYTLFSMFLQRKLTNPAKQREIQMRVKELTKQMQSMAKSGQDISAQQRQLMPLMNESMKLQLRSMFVILPVFFVIYYVALPYIFQAYSGTEITLLGIPLMYSNLFFATVLIFGLILSAIVLANDRKLMKAAQQKKQQEQQSQQ